MNHGRPLLTAAWHAGQAEDLASTALAFGMRGWWKRGRRRDLLAAAQVHATLAAAAVRTERQMAEATDGA